LFIFSTIVGILLLGLVCLFNGLVVLIATQQANSHRVARAVDQLVAAFPALCLNLIAFGYSRRIPGGLETLDDRKWLDMVALSWLLMTLGLWPLLVLWRRHRRGGNARQ
jgi:hypothetical protein